MQFSKKMNQFGEGIFSKLLEIKRSKIQNGETIIDLSVGTPNIPPAKHILEALCKAAADEKNYVYAICDQSDLLQAASDWYIKRFQVELNPETEICSLLGSQDGLAHIALSLIDEGDLVLVPDPCYPVFADGPRLAGAQIHYIAQKKENGYVIRLDDIPEDIARKAKLMIVSYPNNPTTALAPDCFYQELIAFAKKYDIAVLHDNAYSDLVFDGKKAKSFLAFEGAKEVGVEVNSLSKTYGLAGARVGFCLGNAQIIAQLKILKSNIDYGMFLPVQAAAIAAITQDQQCVEATRNAYQKRRDILCDGFSQIGWKIEKPAATMFVWTQIPAQYQKSEDFVMDMVEKAGVMITPGSAFGPSGEGYVRMALVQEEEVIQKAVQAVRESGILSS